MSVQNSKEDSTAQIKSKSLCEHVPKSTSSRHLKTKRTLLLSLSKKAVFFSFQTNHNHCLLILLANKKKTILFKTLEQLITQ